MMKYLNKMAFTFIDWKKEIEEKFHEGQIVKGTVRKIQTFGAFVQIYPGVDALLPTVEMSDTPNIKPDEVVHVKPKNNEKINNNKRINRNS